MRIYASAFLVAEIGYGIFASVIFIYLDAYLGLGAQFSYIIIAANFATLLSLPVWERICRHTGKKQATALAWLLQGPQPRRARFVPRHGAGFIAVTTIIAANSAFSGAGVVVAPSILGDIIDYDTLKSGGYRAGNYFALYSLATKVVVAIGGGLLAQPCSAGSATMSATRPATAPRANTAMLAIFAILPAIVRFLGIGLLWLYPLNARRQHIVRRRLESREGAHRRSGQWQGENP